MTWVCDKWYGEMEATHVGRNRNRIYCPNGGTEWFVDDEYINEGSDENRGVLGVYDTALIWDSHGKDEDYMFGYTEEELEDALKRS